MEKVASIAAGVAFASMLWRIACARSREYGCSMKAWEPISLALIYPPIVILGIALVPLHSGLSICDVACVGVCAASDRQSGYIFDRVVGLGACATAVILFASGSLASGVAGALFCGALLFLLRLVSRGRGLGLGDVKLGALIGALGVRPGISALACAFITGAVLSGAGIAMQRIRRRDPVRFGPYLALGTWLSIAFMVWPA